ncbi:MAG TPA: response regulator [Anaerolineales bacterium]|nr:response regulator [Anaerolineales bacterium]
MAEEKYTVLIVEDDLDVADMLNAYFRVQGYEVLTVNWGEDGIRACQTSHPDLIILDIRLPDIDGYEVARQLRSNRRTENIPIIFLTEKRARDDRLKGLELGADDYITKPFDIQELRLRVRNSLKRAAQGALNNPITSLAEGPLVDERMAECLDNHDPWAVLVISIENLETFREKYGFIASDDVLRAVSLMISNSVRDHGAPGDFLGHLNGTQFVVISQPSHLPKLMEHITSRLDQSLDYFYPIKDREMPERSPGKRLTIRMGHLISNDDIPADIDAVKTLLLRQLG